MKKALALLMVAALLACGMGILASAETPAQKICSCPPECPECGAAGCPEDVNVHDCRCDMNPPPPEPTPAGESFAEWLDGVFLKIGEALEKGLGMGEGGFDVFFQKFIDMIVYFFDNLMSGGGILGWLEGQTA